VPFDSFVAAAVAEELRRELVEGTVGKIHQPEPLLAILHLRAGRRNHRLLLSSDARCARVCLSDTSPPNPPTPPQFCRVLRKHLEGARLASVEAAPLDRVLTLRFTRSDGERTLIAEVMGKHSNLVLLDDQGVILDAMKAIGHRVNRYRELLPGRPYLPPPAPDRPSPLGLGQEEIALRLSQQDDFPSARALLQAFSGLGGFAAEAVLAGAPSPTPEGVARSLHAYLGRLERLEFGPHVFLGAEGLACDCWAFSSGAIAPEAQREAAGMSAALEEAARTEGSRSDLALSRQQVMGRLRAALARVNRRLELLGKDLKKAERAEEYRVAGELLMAHQGQVPKGANIAELPNYYTGTLEPLRVTLDPALDARGNAEAYFRKYRKACDGGPVLERQRQEAQEAGEALELLLMCLEEAAPEELPGLLLQAEALVPTPPPQPTTTGRAKPAAGEATPKVKQHTSVDGWEILRGETKEGNDYLTTRLSSPDDLWLHVRGAASAHVVVRTHKRPEAVPRTTLLEAARVAAAHSEAKHSSVVAVDYTLRKYVRKPRGSAPGQVVYQNEKTLHVEPGGLPERG
jgi:predicted ribosome quality control (RQC) complex YloA/Tae2 family protein